MNGDADVSEALTQQQIQGQQAMHVPGMFQAQQQVQAALVAQTNPLHVLDDIEQKLRGKRMDYDGQYKKISEPLMNEQGIGRMLFLVSSIVNQNTILSHLESQEIGKLITKIGDDIVDDLVLNWYRYGIKDKMLLDHIVDVILIPSFMALKRAWKQNEKNWLGKVTVETLNNAPRVAMKKEGFWSKLKL